MPWLRSLPQNQLLPNLFLALLRSKSTSTTTRDLHTFLPGTYCLQQILHTHTHTRARARELHESDCTTREGEKQGASMQLVAVIADARFQPRGAAIARTWREVAPRVFER